MGWPIPFDQVWFSRVFLKIHPWINVGKYAKIILMPVFPHFPLGESTSGGDPLGSSRWLCRGPKRHLGSALSTRLRQEPAVQDGAEALSSCWLQRKVPRLPLDFTVEKGWCEGFAKCQELVGSVVLWAGLCLLTNLICALLVVGIWNALHPITQRLGPSNKFDCQKCGQTVCLRHRYEEEHDCRRGWPKAHALGFGSMSVSRPSQNTLGIWNLLICLRLRGQSICLSPTCSVSALWFHHWRISNHPPSCCTIHTMITKVSMIPERHCWTHIMNIWIQLDTCGSNKNYFGSFIFSTFTDPQRNSALHLGRPANRKLHRGPRPGPVPLARRHHPRHPTRGLQGVRVKWVKGLLFTEDFMGFNGT